jgi:hypothetical protein
LGFRGGALMNGCSVGPYRQPSGFVIAEHQELPS